MGRPCTAVLVLSREQYGRVVMRVVRGGLVDVETVDNRTSVRRKEEVGCLKRMVTLVSGRFRLRRRLVLL